jgi:hypothetical protein
MWTAALRSSRLFPPAGILSRDPSHARRGLMHPCEWSPVAPLEWYSITKREVTSSLRYFLVVGFCKYMGSWVYLHCLVQRYVGPKNLAVFCTSRASARAYWLSMGFRDPCESAMGCCQLEASVTRPHHVGLHPYLPKSVDLFRPTLIQNPRGPLSD